ncbi:unnamed protein product (mitochondrion) [Plasmodiophora brassicae]|uniref:Uncharacterized protein n=1 Tax=Plasmodiophora brassicae TaxID=37360 RepID=A0A3P3Y9Z7_PLABS|nr:unnamed protein product [Plasmodiophora brassicae]
MIPYHERWMKRFPSIADLTAASMEDVNDMQYNTAFIGAGAFPIALGIQQARSTWQHGPTRSRACIRRWCLSGELGMREHCRFRTRLVQLWPRPASGLWLIRQLEVLASRGR